MRSKSPFVSLIIPVYNESGNLEWLNSKFLAFIDTNKIKAEFIYIDDGSTDDSLETIKQLAGADNRVKFIGLSRNFGKEAATTAGLEQAAGDVAVIIDADGQHPIELVKDFLEQWSNGFDVVIGIRKENTGEGFLKRYGSKLFNSLLNSLSGGNTMPGSTDFRLIDRRVIDEFNQLTERNRITRGLIDWLGFKRTYIKFKSPARHSGKASYGFRKLVRLAFHAFISQTTKPLQLTGFLGALVTFVSAFVGIFLIFEKYVFNDPLRLAVTGTAILALFLSFLVGLVLICQWLLALYIESIHNETQNRPLFIVSEKSK